MSVVAASGAPSRRHRRRRSDFVSRTIVGVTQAVAHTVYAEEHARRPGFLQRADPRVKVVLFGFAILVAGLARGVPVLLALYALAVVAALLSKLSVRAFLGRTLLGIPLFAGVVALPALFLIPGPPLLVIGDLGPVHLGISTTAALSVATLVARVIASVSLAALLVLTTRWADLLKALRVLRVPEVFVVVLGMTYRYIFLFLRAVENLFLARASRTVGDSTEREQRRWVGTTMGTLLSKSMGTSHDVYQAMVARGFSGQVRTLTRFRMRDEDWLLLSLGGVLLALALLVDVSLR